MANIIPAEQKRVAEFRKQHGSFKIGEVTVDMVNVLNTTSIVDVSPKVHRAAYSIHFRLTEVCEASRVL